MGLFGPNVGALRGKRDIPGLIRCLGHKTTQVNSDAADALAAIGAEAVIPLCAALGERDLKTRWVAALTLARIGDARAATPLRQALSVALSTWEQDYKATHLTIISATATALGSIGDREAVDVLCHVYCGVFTAIVRKGGVLLFIDENDLADTRASVITAVGRIGGPTAASFLCSGPLEDWRVADALQEALVRIGSAAVEALCSALAHESPARRMGAAQALGRIRDARAVEPLRNLLKDAEKPVRKAAKEALAGLGVS